MAAARRRPGIGGSLRIGGGDVNGFLGLVVDNLSVLALLAAVLIGGFGIPAAIVFGRMFPGTALGVLIGDLAYTWLAVRLARRTGRSDVTAMPFGLDTPSTIGMALLVLGSGVCEISRGGTHRRWPRGSRPGISAWRPPRSWGDETRAGVHRQRRAAADTAGGTAGLAGGHRLDADRLPAAWSRSCARPIVGMLTLGLVLYALVAKGRIPGRMPGVLFAVIVGTLAYYLLGGLGLAGMAIQSPMLPMLRLALPHPDIGIVQGFAAAVDYLPLLLPFALLTVVGGVNNTESARVAGDDYDVRSILLGEAAATLAAGIVGRRGADHALHRPSRLQTDGRASRLYAAHRAVHRRRRDARVSVESDRAGTDRGARAGAWYSWRSTSRCRHFRRCRCATRRRWRSASFLRSRACCRIELSNPDFVAGGTARAVAHGVRSRACPPLR